MNFFKLYPGDYGAKTAHLTLMEHGAYLLLLQQHYTTERPLTTDIKMLARILRADTAAERKAIENVLAQFWTLTAEGWVNPRALEEIERASHQREVNRELGKRGGRPPRNRTETESVSESVSESKPNTKPNHNPNQTPDSRHQTKDPRVVNNPPTPQAAAPPSTELPPGLLADTWKAFRDHRQRLRSPMTRHAEQLLLGKLVKLGLDGYDLNAVVEQSIERGWKGFFPLNGSQADAGAGIREWLHRTDAIEGEYSHEA